MVGRVVLVPWRYTQRRAAKLHRPVRLSQEAGSPEPFLPGRPSPAGFAHAGAPPRTQSWRGKGAGGAAWGRGGGRPGPFPPARPAGPGFPRAGLRPRAVSGRESAGRAVSWARWAGRESNRARQAGRELPRRISPSGREPSRPAVFSPRGGFTTPGRAYADRLRSRNREGSFIPGCPAGSAFIPVALRCNKVNR